MNETDTARIEKLQRYIKELVAMLPSTVLNAGSVVTSGDDYVENRRKHFVVTGILDDVQKYKDETSRKHLEEAPQGAD